MAAIRFVWGYRFGLLLAAGLFAAHSLANGNQDQVVGILDFAVELLRN